MICGIKCDNSGRKGDLNMKKNLKKNILQSKKVNSGSILGLMTSHTMMPVIYCSLLLMLVQGCTFAYLGINQESNLLPLYQWLDHPMIRYSFIIVMLVVLAACYRVGEGSGNPGYTIHRLGVKEKQIFSSWMLNVGCSIIIIWGIQVLTIFLGSKYYEMVTPENLTSVQTMFLSSYRSAFLHTIMPVQDWSVWLRNIAFVLCLSSGISWYTLKRLRGEKNPVMLGITVFLMLLYFNIGSGTWDIYVTAFLLVSAMFMIYGGAIYEE